MNSPKDQIYRSPATTALARSGSFVFDQRVAKVFADMISRSVPGYQQILEMLPTLTRQFRFNNSNYYDLGCSLGAGMLAMAKGLSTDGLNANGSEADDPEAEGSDAFNATLIGIDNSAAMIAQAARNLAILDASAPNYCLLEQDILGCKLDSAAMVLMNFTLQFIALEHRDALVEKIYASLVNGGALVLSEKIKFDDAKTNQTLIGIHHQYKADQGYSQMEIAQKRDAIENVLIPETLETHTRRLKDAGFSVVTPWVQNLQFISILAVK